MRIMCCTVEKQTIMSNFVSWRNLDSQLCGDEQECLLWFGDNIDTYFERAVGQSIPTVVCSVKNRKWP